MRVTWLEAPMMAMDLGLNICCKASVMIHREIHEFMGDYVHYLYQFTNNAGMLAAE
jgi:hypothetical protein